MYNDSLKGSVLGALTGFFSATGFALYTVTIRWRPETPKFTTVVLAGSFCAIFSFLMLGTSFESFSTIPVINIYLSLLHGCIVASGLILFSFGAKYLPAAELALLTLMEVVGGVVWVWLPVFGINEVPSMTVIIGGFFVTFAVLMHGFGASRKREPVTL
jgi:drug/metabolite transporter (DMT)-like permease